MKMIVAALLLFLSGANALPGGAPTKVCETMLPFHDGGIAKQSGPPPFSILTRGNNREVLVTVKSAIEIPFKGIMLQARMPNGELAGTFEPINNDVHTIDCQNPGDTITHNSPTPKPSVEVRWKPPNGYDGSIQFNATVAQDYSTFWTGVQSEALRLSNYDQPFQDDSSSIKSSTPPYYIPEQTTMPNKPSDPFYEGCDVNKLCFGIPDGCVKKQNCKALTAVTVNGDRYEFELKGIGQAAWVGVGLSNDDKMGNDSVLECVKDGSTIKPYLSWTTPRPNLNAVRIQNPQQGIQLLNGSIIDDAIYCRVLRETRTIINGVEFDLAATKYYVLIAAGTGLKQNSVAFHDIGYIPSGSARYLSDVSDVVGASKILIRLHGAFMLAAWIGTATLGTFIARYYRKTWVGKTLCGKDLWFAWHRFFMVTTWSLTTVAFILIFVELKGWSLDRNPHAILGCIVTALCFIQPIGAFFRPHPGTPKRPIFNWLHWLGGNSAHILAIITIFFAQKLDKTDLPIWFDYILAAFVVFHVLMHLVLSILSCVSENATNERVSAFPMKDLSSPGNMSSQMVNADTPYSGARKALLGLYFLVVAALVIALIVVVVSPPGKS